MTVAPGPLPRHAPRRHEVLLAGLLVLALAGVAVLLAFRHDVFTGASSSTAVEGSGVAATQTRGLPAFGSVELAGSNTVTINVGGRQSVVVHADDNLLSHVTTQVRGGRLLVGNTPGSFSARTPMHVDIRMPSLDALALTGSGVVVASGVDAPSLSLTLGGSGLLRASGVVQQLEVSLSGSGDAQLEQLAAQNVHAVVGGSGRILVNAVKTLHASVSGTGVIVYSGNPAHVTRSVTGVGTIVHG